MYSTEDDDGIVCVFKPLTVILRPKPDPKTMRSHFLPNISLAVVEDMKSYAINVKKINTKHKINTKNCKKMTG